LRLSTRSRYGTRLMLDIAKNSNSGAIQLNDIAKRQDISVKYLEQIIIPLKKAKYVKSVRGAKGGYILGKPPCDVTVGEIVSLLEGGTGICECLEKPRICKKSNKCMTRKVWIEATNAMYEKLNSITLLNLMENNGGGEKKDFSCY